METETLGERIRSGKQESKRKGIHQGRKKGSKEQKEVVLNKVPCA
jgi:DNA invertase Pin-like site-specific DNA recombinase